MLLPDPASLKRRTPDPHAVVIVGGGAVGLHLAAQIVRRGRSVIVLESGDDRMSSFGSDSYEVVGRKHDGIEDGRCVAVGGTSNLWGGQLVEFMPADFQRREQLGIPAWPIEYEEVAEYYGPTYSALGISEGLQQDAPVWRGIKKEPPSFSNGLEVMLTRWMSVPNVALRYREDIENNPRLLVVQQATCTGFEAEGDRLTGVRVVDRSGERHTIHGADIVLSAGAIENARLLLHTAAEESWRCPWRGNDNIGRYFHDHLGGRLAYIHPRNKKAFFDVFSTIVHRGHKFQPKVRLTNDLLMREPVLACQAMIAFESSIKENLVFLKQFVKAALHSRKIGSVSAFFKNLLACSRHMIPLMWKYIVEHRILIPSGSRISLILQSEVEPEADSRIAIDTNRRDKLGISRVRLDWRLAGRELDSIRAFAMRVADAFDKSGLADLEFAPGLEEADAGFLDSLRDTNHQSGGCVMGGSATDGVVDRDLRVFNTANCYVAGPGVFRTNSQANTTFTAMTLATRLADQLTKPAHAAD